MSKAVPRSRLRSSPFQTCRTGMRVGVVCLTVLLTFFINLSCCHSWQWGTAYTHRRLSVGSGVTALLYKHDSAIRHFEQKSARTLPRLSIGLSDGRAQ